jgi:hypothetical protein
MRPVTVWSTHAEKYSAEADVRAVRGRAPALVESAARDRGLGMIPGDRLAAVECLAESNARRNEELASPRRDAAQLAIPDDVRDSLPALATRAAHLGEHRAERVRAGGIVRSTAEKPDAVVAQRHHQAALLVIEFGVPKELEAAAVGVQRGGRRVPGTHVQVMHLQHEFPL